MDWQRVSHILFTWICTLKHEVLTAALEMHGESHSELKFSSGVFFLGCFSTTVTQSRLQTTCAGEDCRVLSFQTYPHVRRHVLSRERGVVQDSGWFPPLTS